jgi:hypothetical protein
MDKQYRVADRGRGEIYSAHDAMHGRNYSYREGLNIVDMGPEPVTV